MSDETTTNDTAATTPKAKAKPKAKRKPRAKAKPKAAKGAKVAKLFTSAKVVGAVMREVFKLAGTPVKEIREAANKEVRVQMVYLAIGAMGLGRCAMANFGNLADTLTTSKRTTGIVANVDTAKGIKVGTEYSESQRYGAAIDGAVFTGAAYGVKHAKQLQIAIDMLASNAVLSAIVVQACNLRLAELQAQYKDGTYSKVKPLTLAKLKLQREAIAAKVKPQVAKLSK